MLKRTTVILSLILVFAFSLPALAENVKTPFADGSLNVRSGPGTNYKVVAWVKNGQAVTVLSESGAWSRIKVNATGKTGYILSSYIEKEEASAPGTYAVYALGSVKTRYAASTVHVRKGPGTKYAVDFEVRSGEKMRLIGESGNWYLINTEDGKTGYISKNYTSLGASGETTANVNMRQGASSASASMGVLPKGTKITLTGVTGNWTEVSYNGNTGFIYTKYVK